MKSLSPSILCLGLLASFLPMVRVEAQTNYDPVYETARPTSDQFIGMGIVNGQVFYSTVVGYYLSPLYSPENGLQFSHTWDFLAIKTNQFSIATALPETSQFVLVTGNQPITFVADTETLGEFSYRRDPPYLTVTSNLTMTADMTGAVFMSDPSSNVGMIYKYDSVSSRLPSLTINARVTGMTVGPDGLLYTVDMDQRKVIKYNASGIAVGSFALDNNGGPAPGVDRSSITVDNDGNVYVYENSTQHLYGYSADGTWIADFAVSQPPLAGGVNALFIDDNGYLYLGEAKLGNIKVYDIAPTLTGTTTIGAGEEYNLTVAQLARDAGTSGTINLEGGTLTLRNVRGGQGEAAMNLTGTIRLASDNTSLFSGFQAGDITLTGPLTLDTQDHTATTYAAFGGVGSLIKQGSGSLTLAGSSIFSGSLSPNEGTLTLTGSVTSSATSGIATTGGTATLNISGSTANWTSNSDILIGHNGGTGFLNITDGATASDTFALVGRTAGGTGHVTVSGEGSIWTHSAGLVIGTGGTGTMLVEEGGKVSNADGTIGGDAGSSGTVTITGTDSLWTSTSWLVVGSNGSGSLTVADGGVAKVGSTGTGTLTLGNSGAGSGTLNIGAAVGQTATAAGTVQAGSVTGGNGSGTKLVNFNHTGTDYVFASNLGGSLKVEQNAGTTILTGNNTHSGGTIINGGTLSIGNGGTTGSVAGDITNNASLIFNRSGSLTHNGGISGSGSLTKTGSGTVTLTNTNTYTGGTTVEQGRLAVNGSINGPVNVAAAGALTGNGRINGTISGGGQVGPGNSPGILTAEAVDPSDGLDFSFELGLAGMPLWANASASGNDVLHLTLSTPFTEALSADNTIRLFFADDNTTYYGGLFTDEVTDLLSSNITDASYLFYLLDNVNGAVEYNGNLYTQFLSGVTLLVEKVEDADFASGTTNGYVQKFEVALVPEPSIYALAIGMLLGALIFRRRRQRASDDSVTG